MGKQTSQKLGAIMSKDVRFLRQNNLMDYSLLLGIETIQNDRRYSTNVRNNIADSEYKNTMGSAIRSSNELRLKSLGELMQEKHQFYSRTQIFHISIIDYLQQWDCNKKMERLAKIAILQKDGDLISAINPAIYSCRFRKFMKRDVFTN